MRARKFARIELVRNELAKAYYRIPLPGYNEICVRVARLHDDITELENKLYEGCLEATNEP